jgi:soluble lytic murein transglycosylase-like protein
MRAVRLAAVLAAGTILLSGCAGAPPAQPEVSRALPLYPNETPELRQLIDGAASRYDVPEDLVQRVVIRESRHRPTARNGPYYGLMQILPATARSMGFQGRPEALLDPATNLEYAVKYLRGAWLVSGGNRDRAVGLYAKGYYHEAKAAGLLDETGLR